MKITKPIVMSTAVLLASASCTTESEKNADFGDTFSIEALQALGRVSDPQISPDKSKILYGISY